VLSGGSRNRAGRHFNVGCVDERAAGGTHRAGRRASRVRSRRRSLLTESYAYVRHPGHVRSSTPPLGQRVVGSRRDLSPPVRDREILPLEGDSQRSLQHEATSRDQGQGALGLDHGLKASSPSGVLESRTETGCLLLGEKRRRERLSRGQQSAAARLNTKPASRRPESNGLRPLGLKVSPKPGSRPS
jgi:hypothetical protein